VPRFTARLRVPVPAADLFGWHERPGAFERLTPPWQPVALERTDGIRSGDRAVIRLGVGRASVRWVAEHQGYDDACRVDAGAACQFRDVQVSGPFAAWTHRHRMTPDGPGASVLEDDVDYALPLAPLSTSLGGGIAQAQLERLFAYRHRVTHADLSRHAAAGLPPLTVAMTGASGLVGSALAAFLSTGGHRVARFVRSREEAAQPRPWDAPALYWNPDTDEIDLPALRALAPDVVIHLAGEPVAALGYTAAKKRRIWESRTRGTQLLSRALAALDTPPRLFLSASASGIYGDRGAEPVGEADAPGTGFLADVCRAWEASTAEAEAAGIRTVHARIGLVLSPKGGLLAPLAAATQVGLGGWVGAGTAFAPWIALDDVLYAVLHLIGSDLAGPVNLSAPAPATTRSLARTLGRVLRRPAVLAVPAGLVRALGGEAAREIALTSVRMLPRRLRADGFDFAYPTLDGALRHVTGHA
jgi:uncharacterized protein (TIGR01777 family)